MQSQQEIGRCIEGLTLYAIERDICMESGDTDARTGRIRGLISGMSELYGLPGKLSEAFDERIGAARGCFASETASIRQQKDTVLGLALYAEDLTQEHGDPRPAMLEIRDLFEEMYAYLPWNPWNSGLNEARDDLDFSLSSITALQNIVFTRVLLGGDMGPAASDFVSGAVTDAGSVSSTRLYNELRRQYPEITEWPGLCSVWRGGFGRGDPVPAAELDLDIIRRSGDRFLKCAGIVCCGLEHQIFIDAPGLSFANETSFQMEDAGPRMTL